MTFTHVFPPKGKELKWIHTLNQVVKKIYNKYVVDLQTGFVFGDVNERVPNKGTHFAIYRDILNLKDILPEEITHLVLYSDNIFSVMKEYKKNITGIQIDQQEIYFTLDTNQKYQIGSLDVPEESKQVFERSKDVYRQFIDVTLTEDYVYELLDKRLVVIQSGNYKLRATKELVPGINAKSLLYVGFSDTWIDHPNHFNTIMITERTGVHVYHVYTCIHYMQT
jgi:hypothetical protein